MRINENRLHSKHFPFASLANKKKRDTPSRFPIQQFIYLLVHRRRDLLTIQELLKTLLRVESQHQPQAVGIHAALYYCIEFIA